MNAKLRNLNTNKLLNSKWTAVAPKNKEKHFMVTSVMKPELPNIKVEFVELEAVHSKVSRIIAWQELTDINTWQQGWL